MPENEEWRQVSQALPKQVYDRWQMELKRLGRVNGISVESFEGDSKFLAEVGPRVMVYELLTILLERSEDEALRV